jgi:probable phosphoglycerate mutase
VTRVLLVRHGLTDAVGTTLAGRQPGWPLNAAGRAQVRRLAEALARSAIQTVYTSPLERARETADAIAERRRVVPRLRPGLNEVDYGAWTGRTFTELSQVPEWDRFNRHRGLVRVPGGEMLCEVQARIAGELEALAAAHPGETIALVSHGDVIKSAIARCLGMPLDLLMRVEVQPASVSVIEVSEWGGTVRAVNLPPEAAGTACSI